MTTRFQSLFADPYGAPTLIRRLLADHALRHRKLYIAAFLMMGVAAACTALSAYLLGDVVNQAYVHKNFQALLIVGIAAFGLFALKGAATYGQQVIMMRIGNRIVADNQRRMFDKLLTENIGFFSDRHSSEFIARLTTGATATNLVLSLLITSIGRDVLTLIGLFAVMVIQDPVMSLVGLIIAPPAMLFMRKLVRRVRAIIKVQFTGGTQTIETLQETLQGLRVVKAFTLEDEMRRRFDTQRVGGAARGRQVGARREPRQPADGDARRPRDRACHHLQRVSDHLQRCGARRLHLVPRRVPARL